MIKTVLYYNLLFQILRAIIAIPNPTSKTGKNIENVNPGIKKNLGRIKIPPITIRTNPADRFPAIRIKPTIIRIICQEKIKWKIP